MQGQNISLKLLTTPYRGWLVCLAGFEPARPVSDTSPSSWRVYHSTTGANSKLGGFLT